MPAAEGGIATVSAMHGPEADAWFTGLRPVVAVQADGTSESRDARPGIVN
ncbi:hypothetical protein [Marinobacter mangrovi]|nr:hypothetical protein [Marinobacter mangrovi]